MDNHWILVDFIVLLSAFLLLIVSWLEVCCLSDAPLLLSQENSDLSCPHSFPVSTKKSLDESIILREKC